MAEDASWTLKRELRRTMLARRRELRGKDALSRQILQRIGELPKFQAARIAMFYVHARSEVRTREALQAALHGGREIAVPYCDGGELVPWRLKSFDELTPGAFGILEPAPHLRALPERRVDPQDIDLVLVPGVAFDRRGNRLGSGRGYYDRLLPRLREDALRIGVAFACQIVDEVPAGAHDVPMDCVATEERLYETPLPPFARKPKCRD